MMHCLQDLVYEDHRIELEHKKYLERKYKKANFYTVTNGVVLPSEDCIKEKQFGYTLGILHYWGCGALIEIDWFVKSYLPKLRLKYPQLKVIAAGRGADNTVKEYFDRNRIIFLGEVENLCDFFNSIDIYIQLFVRNVEF